MSRFWNPIVHQLQPYVPGEQPKVDNLTKLNTNENPYGPSAKVVAAISDANDDGLRLYPDPNADLLKQKLADYYQVSRDQVFVGNGSDEVLAHTFKALFQPDADILFPDISYSFYPVYCALFELSYRTPALNSDFDIVSSDYQGNNGGIIFPNPNAPTGKVLALEAIQDILHDNPNSVVVVDEAYIDFGGQSAVSLIANNPNLLVVQTLSKSRSLAGLRVGFALGHAELIAGLERVKNSFNSYPLDRFAIAGAVAALDDEDYFKQTCNSIIASRERLSTALTGLGFDVLPSAANFIFVKHPQHNAEQLAQQLRQKNIIVRYFNKPRIDQYLRITIGTDAECDLLINALNTLVHKNSI